MKGNKVLIIDDEPDIVSTIKYLLEEAGYYAFSSDNGQEGLRRVKQDKPDLVILDLNLPKLPGEEVCREIKKDEKTKGIPIIMLTAKKSDVDRVLGRVIGADYYMVKPFDPDLLNDKIRELLDRRLL
ncbi:MAG: response regulator [Candidatus Omnitrophota bacterium]|nr:response regulator [Candidatus Omnitrophota bacterium]